MEVLRLQRSARVQILVHLAGSSRGGNGFFLVNAVTAIPDKRAAGAATESRPVGECKVDFERTDLRDVIRLRYYFQIFAPHEDASAGVGPRAVVGDLTSQYLAIYFAGPRGSTTPERTEASSRWRKRSLAQLEGLSSRERQRTLRESRTASGPITGTAILDLLMPKRGKDRGQVTNCKKAWGVATLMLCREVQQTIWRGSSRGHSAKLRHE